ncbi:MAG: hypothetical protein Q4B54_08575 [Coriobacteriales bacterium]|nr:hypothetical protein [Coriobacteriales bacterium]
MLIAVVAVFVYANLPWTLCLRPWDASLLRAGMSIIAGVALAGVFVSSTYFTLKDPDVKLLEPSEILDDDDVVPVLQEYTDKPFVGNLVADAVDQIESATRKQERLHKVIDSQFAAGSLSWDRFINLVDNAQRTVLRNSSLIANHVQSFDIDVYKRARKATTPRDDKGKAGRILRHLDNHRDTGSKSNSILHNEQLAVYDKSLEEMREILTANERVLLEMGKLELELSKLDANDQMEENSQTVTDLQTLIEETQYYQ